MGFVFEKQNIKNLVLIKPDSYCDHRGEFLEFYKESVFKQNGIKEKFYQDNFSYSKKNVFRGLHFQKKPHSQSKLVCCLDGEILDIVVDLRKNSKTYKQVFKTILSKENHNILYIPENFAHGFFAKKDSIVLYKTSKEYNFESECGINYKDNELNLELETEPIISKKDKIQPNFKDIEIFL